MPCYLVTEKVLKETGKEEKVEGREEGGKEVWDRRGRKK